MTAEQSSITHHDTLTGTSLNYVMGNRMSQIW